MGLHKTRPRHQRQKLKWQSRLLEIKVMQLCHWPTSASLLQMHTWEKVCELAKEARLVHLPRQTAEESTCPKRGRERDDKLNLIYSGRLHLTIKRTRRVCQTGIRWPAACSRAKLAAVNSIINKEETREKLGIFA